MPIDTILSLIIVSLNLTANIGTKKKEQYLVTKDLISKGYQVLHINEREYDENPLKVIDKCVMFLDKDIK